MTHLCKCTTNVDSLGAILLLRMETRAWQTHAYFCERSRFMRKFPEEFLGEEPPLVECDANRFSSTFHAIINPQLPIMLAHASVGKCFLKPYVFLTNQVGGPKSIKGPTRSGHNPPMHHPLMPRANLFREGDTGGILGHHSDHEPKHDLCLLACPVSPLLAPIVVSEDRQVLCELVSVLAL